MSEGVCECLQVSAGDLRVFAVVCRCLWVSVGICGLSADVYEYLQGVCGFLRVSVGVWGYLRVSVVVCRCLRVSAGCLKVCAGVRFFFPMT